MHGKGGMHGKRACMAGETATAADGTHPTGMHSCFAVLFMILEYLYTPLFSKEITSNDSLFDCPIIYVDTIQNAVLS